MMAKGSAPVRHVVVSKPGKRKHGAERPPKGPAVEGVAVARTDPVAVIARGLSPEGREPGLVEFQKPTKRPAARTLTGRSEEGDPGARGIRVMQEAMTTRDRPAFDPFDAIAKPREAAHQEEEGLALLTPHAGEILRGGGEAMVPDIAAGNGLTVEQRGREIAMIDTLEHPTMATLGASQLRMEALARVGILQPGMDTAQTAEAANSIEKMLCHQLAALHHHGMGLMAQAVGADELRATDPILGLRYTNGAIRCFDAFQNGAIVLQKLKTGGKQTVVVQHVTVSDGGQAVIAGQVRQGRGIGRRRGKGPKQ